MVFKRMDAAQRPPRQGALVGHPNSGKSTFGAQICAPILAVDADRHSGEVQTVAAGAVYRLSDTSADNMGARCIAALLCAGVGVRQSAVAPVWSW